MVATKHDVLAKIATDFGIYSSPKGNYSQSKLFDAFKEYMTIQGQDSETLSYFTGRFCSGLSMAFSTFHIQNKRQWWTTLLKQIIDHKHLYSTPNYLDELATDWQLPNARAPQSHRQLIERAINYILFSNASIKVLPPKMRMNLTYDSLNQVSYFSTKKQTSFESNLNHEYVTTKGGIKTIKNSQTIAGYFNHNLLVRTLNIDTKDIAENIIKISTPSHSCSLIFDKEAKKFGFYDPNDISGDAKWFSDKDSVSEYIINHLGNKLIIAWASASNHTPCIFSSFYKAIKNKDYAAILMSNKALPLIFHFTPKLADDLLNQTLVTSRLLYHFLIDVLTTHTRHSFFEASHINDILKKILLHPCVIDHPFMESLNSSQTETFKSQINNWIEQRDLESTELIVILTNKLLHHSLNTTLSEQIKATIKKEWQPEIKVLKI